MYREYLESGKTIKAWCEENGIARTTFHNSLRQIREAALEPKQEIVPVSACVEETHTPTANIGAIEYSAQVEHPQPQRLNIAVGENEHLRR